MVIRRIREEINHLDAALDIRGVLLYDSRSPNFSRRTTSESYGASGSVFEQLRAIQRDFGYLPAEQLQALAAEIKVPVSQIHAVASFYPHFHLTPPPKADVRVCADMSCHLLGGDQVKADLETTFRGVDANDVSIRDVSCLGRCDHAPAIMVNDQIYAHVNSQEAVALAQDARAGKPLPEPHQDDKRMAVVSDPYSGTGHMLSFAVSSKPATGKRSSQL